MFNGGTAKEVARTQQRRGVQASSARVLPVQADDGEPYHGRALHSRNAAAAPAASLSLAAPAEAAAQSLPQDVTATAIVATTHARQTNMAARAAWGKRTARPGQPSGARS